MRTPSRRPSASVCGDRSERGPWAGAAAALLGATVAGCASKPGVLFDPANGAWRWPAPPDAARIRYIGQLASDHDLKPGRSMMQSVGETMFGKESPRTMVSPLAVCTDGADRVFVADSGAQAVHVFDLFSRRYQQWRPPEKIARFSQPIALAWDPRAVGPQGAPPGGRLLVSDSVEGVLFVFGDGGGYLGTLGKGSLKRPCGLVVDAARGRVLVADAGAHQVVVLSLDGHEIGRVGGRGVGLGEFNFPTNVALDAAGRLYVSDSLNFRVQVFGPDLAPIRQIGSKGDLPGYFAQPKGLALDPEGHVYVVDSQFEAVQVFDPDGRLLMAFGREGHGPGEFWLPAGLCADPRGRIWVADSYNRRVQVFQFLPEGTNP